MTMAVGFLIPGAIAANTCLILWRRARSCFNRGDYKICRPESARGDNLAAWASRELRRWDESRSDPPFLTLRQPCRTRVLLAGVGKRRDTTCRGCRPAGYASGGHGHADALSVCLQSEVTTCCSIPGPTSMWATGGDRDLFRGTAMHNTLRVDGADQAETARLSHGRTYRVKGASDGFKAKFDLLMASHDGYHRLHPPVTHRAGSFR